MHPRGPEPSGEVAAVTWIEPRLIPGFGALVGRMVPTGYEAYARVLHPASDRDGEPVRWAEVARVTGRTVHALAQWHRLVGVQDPFDDGGLWPGGEPAVGQLEARDLAALADILSRHTADDDCWFCWDVHGRADRRPGSTSVVTFRATGPDQSSRPAPPASPRPRPSSLPRVQIGGERYLLARGPVRSALFIGWFEDQDTFWQEAPGLWWSHDRSWCVGSNMDIDSTVIGGSQRLIDDVLHDPRLETFPVRPHDSLMFDADLINQQADEAP